MRRSIQKYQIKPTAILRRENPVDLIVLHWNGGGGDADQMFGVLEQRKLSVHYHLGEDGTITQYCDPGVYVALHAGLVNSRSIGIELQMRPFAGPQDDWIESLVRGQRVLHARPTRAQVISLLWLLDTLTHEHKVPRQLPAADDTLSRTELDRFAGICGHYHVSRNKLDPGSWLIQRLRRYYCEV